MEKEKEGAVAEGGEGEREGAVAGRAEGEGKEKRTQVTIPLSSLQQKDKRIAELEAKVAQLKILKRRRKPATKPKQPNPHEILEEMLKSCPEGCRNFIRAQLSQLRGWEKGKRKEVQYQSERPGAADTPQQPKGLQIPTKHFCSTLQNNNTQIYHRTCGILLCFLQGILSQMGVIASNMTPAERMCTLVLDEMAIKRQFDYDRRNDAIYGVSPSGYAAKQAMVIMVRGILGNSMPAVEIASIIKDAIQNLKNIGLTVQAVICDQATTNIKALHLLGATLDPLGGEDSHCILVGVQRVPVVFDVPHLLKSIRNNLFKYGIKIQGKDVFWRHISNFYEIDKLHTIRMAPKLTERHISLPAFSKMRVSLATQVFSHTVSAGISAMVSLMRLPAVANNTGEFIAKINRLFDVLISRSAKDSNPWRRPLGTGSQEKENFLVDCVSWVAGWQFRSVNKKSLSEQPSFSKQKTNKQTNK
ncbi:Transposable element P transposase [Merluccius polli]|uniref:Transposable element P transposase n=1 Tax=Merluccius polli TaxID=89951 RepID=A0AA47M013_MERPO|nr:Transposable element P transposase [Merluccius polli]